MEAPIESEVKGQIAIKVVSQDGSEVYFKIKKTTQFRKLMDAFASRRQIKQSDIRFLFDGNRVQPEQTAEDIGMEDGDIMDAVTEQTGGFLK